MSDLKSAAKLALEALKGYRRELNDGQPCDAEKALEEALAKQALQALHDENERLGLYEQGEPVAWMHKQGNHEEPSFRQLDNWEISNGWKQYPLYAAPPQRTWVGLTDEEISEFDTWHDNREEEVGWCNPSEIVAYIEAKLKEKNT